MDCWNSQWLTHFLVQPWRRALFRSNLQYVCAWCITILDEYFKECVYTIAQWKTTLSAESRITQAHTAHVTPTITHHTHMYTKGKVREQVFNSSSKLKNDIQMY